MQGVFCRHQVLLVDFHFAKMNLLHKFSGFVLGQYCLGQFQYKHYFGQVVGLNFRKYEINK